MSSANAFRKAAPRRTHRERAQPLHRKRKGLLEKHKDYVKRARDYHRKETRLKVMREKASFRNPDEFYFRMVNARTENGVHRGERSLKGKGATAEEDLLLRSQDGNYVGSKLAHEQAVVERLRAELQGASVPTRAAGAAAPAGQAAMGQRRQGPRETSARQARGQQSAKTVYASSRAEAEAYTAAAGEAAPSSSSSAVSRQERRRMERAYRELEQRAERVRKLRRLVRQIDVEKQQRGKGAKKKVTRYGRDGPAVYRWRTQRQK